MIRSMKLVTTLSGALVLAASVAAADPIGVRINGESVRFSDASPQMVEAACSSRCEESSEKMGADVHWNNATQVVTAQLRQRDIWLQLGRAHGPRQCREVRLDVPATMIDGSTMVPLRFVGEALGGAVGWDNSEQTVMIDTRAPLGRHASALGARPRARRGPARPQKRYRHCASTITTSCSARRSPT